MRLVRKSQAVKEIYNRREFLYAVSIERGMGIVKEERKKKKEKGKERYEERRMRKKGRSEVREVQKEKKRN